MHGLLEGALEEHMGRLRGMTQRIADKAAADARFKELQHLEEVCSSTFAYLPVGAVSACGLSRTCLLKAVFLWEVVHSSH